MTVLSKIVVLIVVVAWAPTVLADQDSEKSTQDLSALIGKWKFVHESMDPVGFDYREKGTLYCYYAYEGAYIQCDGEGDNGRNQRSYSDFLNYNSITDQ